MKYSLQRSVVDFLLRLLLLLHLKSSIPIQSTPDRQIHISHFRRSDADSLILYQHTHTSMSVQSTFHSYTRQLTPHTHTFNHHWTYDPKPDHTRFVFSPVELSRASRYPPVAPDAPVPATRSRSDLPISHIPNPEQLMTTRLSSIYAFLSSFGIKVFRFEDVEYLLTSCRNFNIC